MGFSGSSGAIPPPEIFYLYCMGRIKLEIPADLPFVCQMTIRVTDLNYANHLANDRLLGMLHEARYQYFQHHGYSEMDIEGVGTIQGDCAIVFKQEGRYGQDILIYVGVGDYSRVSFDMFYRLVNKESGKVIAEAKTGIICFDYHARQVKSVPDALKESFGDQTIVPN